MQPDFILLVIVMLTVRPVALNVSFEYPQLLILVDLLQLMLLSMKN